MNRFAFILIALSCISCSRPSAVPAAPEIDPAKQAMDAFFTKAFKRVRVLDDRISDARTIALALTNSCISEYNAYTEATCTAVTLKGRNYYRAMRNTDSEKIQASLEIVLMHRAGKLPKE